MNHSHDNVLNILTTFKKCIDASSAASRKFMKKAAFEATAVKEREWGCKLADMSQAEVELIEDTLIMKFC